MYSLSFMGKVTFWGKLRLTRILGGPGSVWCGSRRNESNEGEYHVL